MARPERNSVDYFPFICNEGKKMYYLEETYGNDGFAVFIKLLRGLATTEYHYLNLSESTSLMFLSAKCKVNKETLELIIKDLVELGKFDKTLWNENKIIWCQDFIDSIQDAYSKRKNKCITYDSLLHLLVSLGIRKQYKSKLKVPVNTQSIVKYSKEDKSKVNIPPFLEFKDYVLLKEKYIDLKALRNKYDAWIENDWKDGNDKKITNWKTKILNTLQYLPKNEENKGNNAGSKKADIPTGDCKTEWSK